MKDSSQPRQTVHPRRPHRPLRHHPRLLDDALLVMLMAQLRECIELLQWKLELVAGHGGVHTCRFGNDADEISFGDTSGGGVGCTEVSEDLSVVDECVDVQVLVLFVMWTSGWEVQANVARIRATTNNGSVRKILHTLNDDNLTVDTSKANRAVGKRHVLSRRHDDGFSFRDR